MASEKIFPYRFDGQACKTCGGKCCRGQQGYVWVSPKEIGKMAETMQMDAAIFANEFAGRLGHVVIQRGKEQQSTHGAVGVERAGKMRGELLTIASQP